MAVACRVEVASTVIAPEPVTVPLSLARTEPATVALMKDSAPVKPPMPRPLKFAVALFPWPGVLTATRSRPVVPSEAPAVTRAWVLADEDTLASPQAAAMVTAPTPITSTGALATFSEVASTVIEEAPATEPSTCASV